MGTPEEDFSGVGGLGAAAWTWGGPDLPPPPPQGQQMLPPLTTPVLLPPAELQRQAAGILGTEEALFVPTATMANLIAGEFPGAVPSPPSPGLPGRKQRGRFMSPSRGGCGGREQPRSSLGSQGEPHFCSGSCLDSHRGKLWAAGPF